jgi:hypothetical protein
MVPRFLIVMSVNLIYPFRVECSLCSGWKGYETNAMIVGKKQKFPKNITPPSSWQNSQPDKIKYGSWRLSLPLVSAVFFGHEYGGNIFLRNVDIFSPYWTLEPVHRTLELCCLCTANTNLSGLHISLLHEVDILTLYDFILCLGMPLTHFCTFPSVWKGTTASILDKPQDQKVNVFTCMCARF